MLLVNVLGIALIALIVWWFLLYKSQDVALAGQGTEIVVDNGVYTRSRIKLPAHKAASLAFMRKDSSPCSEWVLFPYLEISEMLPIERQKTIALPPLEPDEFPFHCQMQMYRGVLKVE